LPDTKVCEPRKSGLRQFGQRCFVDPFGPRQSVISETWEQRSLQVCSPTCGVRSPCSSGSTTLSSFLKSRSCGRNLVRHSTRMQSGSHAGFFAEGVAGTNRIHRFPAFSRQWCSERRTAGEELLPARPKPFLPGLISASLVDPESVLRPALPLEVIE